jgi:DNA-binding NtrC family response regulator
VAERRFRADLFYRLQVLTISLPPLRERADEIPALTRALAPRGVTVSDAAVRALAAYHWPGNIRELKNTLWRAAILAEGAPVGPEHLALAPSPDDTFSLGGPAVLPLDEAERRAIAAALRETGGNKVRAAALLGIARSTLTEKVRKLGLGDVTPQPR